MIPELKNEIEAAAEKLPVGFWTKVNKLESGCWIWMAAKSSKGYGRYSLSGRLWQAHRLSFEAKYGSVPKDKQLDHLCRIRFCVNPDHLRIVTARENILCGIGPTAMNARKTHCPRGHKLSPENLLRITRGDRMCRQCNRIRLHNRRHQIAAAIKAQVEEE